MKTLREKLQHPLTNGLDLNDPLTTQLRLQIIQSKSFLQKIYKEWYQIMVHFFNSSVYPILELGSGAGFLKEYLPLAITSDLLHVPNIDLVCNALHMPFADRTLGGITMTNVLHHLPIPQFFFAEADRCVIGNGAIVMIEPWNNVWAKFIYTWLHNEPFDTQVGEWGCEPGKPLTNANGALPWIMFRRDRALFEREFPVWSIEAILPLMPLVYLLSGGVGMKNLMPGWSYKTWRRLEKGIYMLERKFGMFSLIVLRKKTGFDYQKIGKKVSSNTLISIRQPNTNP